ncbi:MAG: NHL repeat-containing protein [Phycisphaerales bacterium]|nr:NHL repeat-containing protein [Phycisphaerales bacterium]
MWLRIKPAVPWLVCFLGCAAADAIQPAASPDVLDPLGQFDREIINLAEPAAVAFLPSGELVTVEATPPRVIIHDSAGRETRAFGTRGRGPGELLRPAGVCIADDGEIFIADAANDRIQAFDATGAPGRIFGVTAGDGRLSGPCGVAVDARRVVIADTLNNRIVAFDRSGGALLWSSGRYGRAAGEFAIPTDVALSASGEAFVIDSENSRVQRFDLSGRFVREWGLWGYHPGLLAGPTGIAVRGERVYVADAMNHRIQVYSPDGELLYMWGRHVVVPHEGAGKLHYPARIAVSADARRAAVCETFENRVQLFGLRADGKPEPPVAGTTADLGPVAHYGPYIAAGGNRLTLTEPESHSLLVFDTSRADAIHICRFAGRGSKFGEFLMPLAIGVDSGSGLLFAADRGNRRLQMFRYQPEDGEVRMIPNLARFVRAIDYDVLARGTANHPALDDVALTAVRCDDAGRLFVLDARRERMIVLSREFRRAAAWSIRAGAPSPHGATDFVIDAARGRIAIVDSLAARVSVFDPDGNHAFDFGAFGDGDGELVAPFGIAVSASGEFFVTDGAEHRITQFDAAGGFVRAWGEQGLGAGQFFKPRGAVIDARGRLYVVDWGNHRVQWFSQSGEFGGVFGARSYIKPALRRGGAQESRP